MFKCPFTKSKCKTSKHARIAGNKLVLSFPDAVSPMVWQMDLNEVTSSYFEISHDEKENTYTLRMSKQGSSAKPSKIATFNTQDAAVTALNSTADALASTQNRMAPQDSSTLYSNQGTYKKPPSTFKTIFWTVLVLLILIFVVPYFITRGDYTGGEFSGASTTATAPSAPAAGVPMSADDFLRGQ